MTANSCAFSLQQMRGGVAGTLRPVTAALSGNPKTLPWTPDTETAFAAAKEALVAAVPLAHPLPGAVLALAADTSDTHRSCSSR